MGCTVERSVDKSAEGQIIKPKIDGDLLLYNWAQYMDPDLKKRFSEKYGVEVNEVNFDNLEAMVIKLRSGAAYDLIWPSTEYVYRLNKEGLLAKFDRACCATTTTSRASTTARGGTPTTTSGCRTRTTPPGSPGARTRSQG